MNSLVDFVVVKTHDFLSKLEDNKTWRLLIWFFLRLLGITMAWRDLTLGFLKDMSTTLLDSIHLPQSQWVKFCREHSQNYLFVCIEFSSEFFNLIFCRLLVLNPTPREVLGFYVIAFLLCVSVHLIYIH